MAALPVTLSGAFVAFGFASTYIFLLRQFFLGLPRELFEAARVDGRIALPLTMPGADATFVFEFGRTGPTSRGR
jgi:ABC-type glycerol-3-phosphate transport system permease component